MNLKYSYKPEQFNEPTKATVEQTLENTRRLLAKAETAPADSAPGRSVEDIKGRIKALEYYLEVYDQVVAERDAQ